MIKRRYIKKNNFYKKKEEHRINQAIGVPEVRLVGENIQVGIYSTMEALKIAKDLNLDLVEFVPNASPPVCKVIEYSKFIYKKKKKQKQIKAKTKQVIIKEIRFGPNTNQHDFDFKLKHAIKFLNSGEKVKAYVFFKGRSITFKEKGELLLLRFAESLADYGEVEQMPNLEGKKMILTIVPGSKNKKNK